MVHNTVLTVSFRSSHAAVVRDKQLVTAKCYLLSDLYKAELANQRVVNVRLPAWLVPISSC